VSEATNVTKPQIADRVMDALVEFGEERENLSPQARFADLDVDSLDLVELAQIIEDEYEIEVADSDLDKVETIDDVVALVFERTA
jgi:acyl carrier protein